MGWRSRPLQPRLGGRVSSFFRHLRRHFPSTIIPRNRNNTLGLALFRHTLGYRHFTWFPDSSECGPALSLGNVTFPVARCMLLNFYFTSEFVKEGSLGNFIASTSSRRRRKPIMSVAFSPADSKTDQFGYVRGGKWMDTEKSMRNHGWLTCSTFPALLITAVFGLSSGSEFKIQEKTCIRDDLIMQKPQRET